MKELPREEELPTHKFYAHLSNSEFNRSCQPGYYIAKTIREIHARQKRLYKMHKIYPIHETLLRLSFEDRHKEIEKKIESRLKGYWGDKVKASWDRKPQEFGRTIFFITVQNLGHPCRRRKPRSSSNIL